MRRIIPVMPTSPCDIDMVTMLNAGFALLPARRRILLAELAYLWGRRGAVVSTCMAHLARRAGAPTAQQRCLPWKTTNLALTR